MKLKYQNNGTFLFFLAYDIFIALSVLQSSNIDFLLDSWMRYLVALVIIALLAFKLIAYEKKNVRIIIIWVSVLIISAIPIINGYTTPLLVAMLIISCNGLPKEKIILRLQIGLIVWSVVVFALCGVGVISNYVFTHNQSGQISYVGSYGFKYYSTIGYIVMTELMTFLMLRNEKCSWIEIVAVLIANYLLYKVHTTTLAFYAVILYVVGFVLTEKTNILNLKRGKRFWSLLSIVYPWMLMAITFFSVLFYRQTGFRQLLNVFNGNQLIARLRFSSQAMDMYGIKLFGSQVEVFGRTAYVYGNAKSEFYIDSGYIYSLIVYGIIVTLFILFFYSLLLRFIYLTQKPSSYIYIFIIASLCIVNNFLLSITYNPLILIGGSAIIEKVRIRSNHKVKLKWRYSPSRIRS